VVGRGASKKPAILRARADILWCSYAQKFAAKKLEKISDQEGNSCEIRFPLKKVCRGKGSEILAIFFQRGKRFSFFYLFILPQTFPLFFAFNSVF
jgi:hypothetical protein